MLEVAKSAHISKTWRSLAGAAHGSALSPSMRRFSFPATQRASPQPDENPKATPVTHSRNARSPADEQSCLAPTCDDEEGLDEDQKTMLRIVDAARAAEEEEQTAQLAEDAAKLQAVSGKPIAVMHLTTQQLRAAARARGLATEPPPEREELIALLLSDGLTQVAQSTTRTRGVSDTRTPPPQPAPEPLPNPPAMQPAADTAANDEAMVATPDGAGWKGRLVRQLEDERAEKAAYARRLESAEARAREQEHLHQQALERAAHEAARVQQARVDASEEVARGQ